MTEPQPNWRKSSYSDDGNCVEVAHEDGAVFARDSKDDTGPVLRFHPEQWRSFLRGVRRWGI